MARDVDFDVIPSGYEYSYLPHNFGGPWSQPLSCTRCGAIVLGKNVALHDEAMHGTVPTCEHEWEPILDATATATPAGGRWCRKCGLALSGTQLPSDYKGAFGTTVGPDHEASRGGPGSGRRLGTDRWPSSGPARRTS